MTGLPDPEIILYSTPFCRPCQQLKRYLSAHEVAFQVVDVMVDAAAAARLEAGNIKTTPALGIGDRIYAGGDLHPARIDQLLGLE